MKVIKASGFYRDACVAVGISEQTLANWRTRGVAGEAPFVGFFEALLKAESERRLSYLAESKKRGAKKNDAREVHWRAAVTDPDVFSIKHHEIIREELKAACERVIEEFKNEPAILERALSALAAEDRSARALIHAGPITIEGDHHVA